MNIIKNFMPYSGAKSELLPEIIKVVKKTNITHFHDLFGGSGCVSLNIKNQFPDCSVNYTELDKNIFGIVDSLGSMTHTEIISQLESRKREFNLSADNQPNFIKYRKFTNEKGEPLDHLLLTYHAFSSTPRWNSKGEFNGTFGQRTLKITNETRMNLKENCDLLSTISRHNVNMFKYVHDLIDSTDITGHLFYLDPPYLITAANYNGGWHDMLEIQLLDLIDKIVKNGGNFILSNVTHHRNEVNGLLVHWMRKYNSKELIKFYSMSRTSEIETKTIEVLISNLEVDKMATLEEFL